MSHLRHQKNRKFAFYFRGFIEYALIPDFLFRRRLEKWIISIDQYNSQELQYRVNYYNKLEHPFTVPDEAKVLEEISTKSKTYFLDLRRILRYFPPNLRSYFRFGDVDDINIKPGFVKTRPIEGSNANNVLMRLNSLRHFTPIKEALPYRQKKDILVWRGVVYAEHRRILFRKYLGHPLFDIGMTNRKKAKEPEVESWRRPYLSISEQLNNKFILSIEGNDVATNLKWIAQSNSLCLMTKPKIESWFMEGTLVPGKHYVEVRNDYADLLEKIEYYLKHPEEAEKIIFNFQTYYQQFTDLKKEHLIGLLVAKKYFSLSNQLI